MWWWPLKLSCFMEPPGATPHSYGGWFLDEPHNVSLGTMRVLWFEPLLSQGLRPALTYGQVYWMVCSYGIAGPGYQECEEGAWFIGYYKVRECFLSAKWSGLFVLFVLNLGQGSMTCDSSNCDNFEDKSPQIHLVMKPLVLYWKHTWTQLKIWDYFSLSSMKSASEMLFSEIVHPLSSLSC